MSAKAEVKKAPATSQDIVNFRSRPDINLSKPEINELAKKFGVTRTDLIYMALQLFQDFTPEFYEMIESYSKKLNIAPGVVIESLCIGSMAKKMALSEAGYTDTKDVLPEFLMKPDGFIGGDELYKRLKEEYKEDLEKKEQK